MARKGRKPGQWKEVAHGRAQKKRELVNGRGLSNIPIIGQSGSAAYRRLGRQGK